MISGGESSSGGRWRARAGIGAVVVGMVAALIGVAGPGSAKAIPPDHTEPNYVTTLSATA